MALAYSDETNPNYMARALGGAPSMPVSSYGIENRPGAPGAPPRHLGGVGADANLQTQMPGVDLAWSRIFGPATPGTLLAQRTANNGVMPSPQATAPGMNAPNGSGLTPQAAGTTNAAAPGSLNGNQDNGFSQEKQAGGQSNNEKGTTGITGTSPSVMAKALQPAQTSSVPNLSSASAWTPGPASGPNVLNANAPVNTAAASMPTTETKAMQATGAKSTAADTINYGGKTYTLLPGKTRPKVPLGTVSQAQALKWLSNNATEQGTAGGGGTPQGGGTTTPTTTTGMTPAQAAQWLAQNADPGSGLRGVNWAGVKPLTTPINLDGDVTKYGSPAAISALIPDAALGQLATQLYKEVQNLSNVTRATDLAPLTDKIKNEIAALKAYGVNFDPLTPWLASQTPPTGGGQGGGDTTGDGTQPSDGVGGGNNAQPDYSGTNYDLGNKTAEATLPNIQQFINKYGKDWMYAFVAAQELANQQNQQNNQQSAVDILRGADVTAAQNPLQQPSMDLALEMLRNPDPTNWDLIRNQYAAGQSKNANAIVNNIAAGAGRRGLAPGAVQGIQAQALGDAANAASMGLGQLDIQRSQALADARARALGLGAATTQAYVAPDFMRKQNIAQLVANPQANLMNPYQDVASGFADWTAFNKAQNQSSGNSGLNTALGVLGGLGGSLMGAQNKSGMTGWGQLASLLLV